MLTGKTITLAGNVQIFDFRPFHRSLCIEHKIDTKRSIEFPKIVVAKQTTEGESYALFI